MPIGVTTVLDPFLFVTHLFVVATHARTVEPDEPAGTVDAATAPALNNATDVAVTAAIIAELPRISLRLLLSARARMAFLFPRVFIWPTISVWVVRP